MNEIINEVEEITNTQTLIEAIRIIAEKSKTKEEFLAELERLQKGKHQ